MPLAKIGKEHNMEFLPEVIRSRCVEIRDFWYMEKYHIPSTPGAYILLAKPDITFQYPKGVSSIFYIGQHNCPVYSPMITGRY